MVRKISCGNSWTLLSTECWLSLTCNYCTYLPYCKKEKHGEKYAIKLAIDELLIKFGLPSEKLIIMAKKAQKNPILLSNLKKTNN